MAVQKTQFRKALLREKLREGFLYVYQPREGVFKGRLVMQNPDTDLIFVMPSREERPRLRVRDFLNSAQQSEIRIF